MLAIESLQKNFSVILVIQTFIPHFSDSTISFNPSSSENWNDRLHLLQMNRTFYLANLC